MALIPIGPWKRDSTYRVHPLRLKDSTYRVPLLDSKLVRLRYAWYYRIKSPSGPSSALAALGTPQPSFWTVNAVEPRLTYPNLCVVGERAKGVRHPLLLPIIKMFGRKYVKTTMRMLTILREARGGRACIYEKPACCSRDQLRKARFTHTSKARRYLLMSMKSRDIFIYVRLFLIPMRA